VVHGDYEDVLPQSDPAPAVQNRALRTHKGFPDDKRTTHALTIDADGLDCLQS
jgi:hypothetical protein